MATAHAVLSALPLNPASLSRALSHTLRFSTLLGAGVLLARIVTRFRLVVVVLIVSRRVSFFSFAFEISFAGAFVSGCAVAFVPIETTARHRNAVNKVLASVSRCGFLDTCYSLVWDRLNGIVP